MPTTCSIRSPRHKRALLRLVTAAAMALSLGVRPARAQTVQGTNVEEGRALYQRGRAFYGQGRFDEAIALFAEAYQRTRAPELLYDLGQAHRKRGDCAAASDHYRRFISAVTAAEQRARAEARLRELGPCPVATPVAARAPAVTAGAPATSLTATPRRAHDRVWGGLLVGSAALAIAAGATLSWRAHQAGQRTTERVRAGLPWDEAARRDESAGIRDERLGLASFGLAAACAGAGAYFLLRGPGIEAAGLSVSPGEGGVAATWSGRF